MGKLKRAPIVLFIILMSVIAMLPFYMMINMGTYFSEELYTGVKLLPGNYLKQNLETVMKHDFLRYYGNSIIVAVVSSVSGVMVSALTGYALSKFRFKGKKVIYALIISSIAVPLQLGLIGFAIEMRTLGLANSLIPLVVNNVASPFGVFWMTQYIGSSVPDEIIESGRIDGCSSMGIFIKLILPIIKSAIVTIFLILFLWSWNNYLTPLVMINNPDNYTIPLSVALLSSEYRTDYAARILALALSTIPVVIMFCFGSKYLIKGLVAGSVKG